MTNPRRNLVFIIIVVAIILVLVGLTWANLRFSRENPGGNDFLVHWVGTQELIMNGVSPYSDEVAVKIQTIVYGRPAIDGEHELRVAYPLYSAIIFAPFALIQDYNLARALWMTVLEVSIFLIAVVSLSLTNWKLSPILFVIYFLFTFFWYHSVRPLINGNAVVLVSLFVVTAFWAIKKDRYEFAGVLLGLSTIKPQVVILLWIFITIWAFSRKNWNLLLWSYGTVIVLTILGMVILPDWILQNISEIIRYPGYNPPGTPGAIFQEWVPGIGRQLGIGLTLLLGIVLLVEWAASWGKSYDHFIWTACLTLVISQWIGIQTDPGNFIVLYFPLIYIMSNLETRWGKFANFSSALIMIFLTIGLWVLFMSTAEETYQFIQSPILFFPLPFILLIGLYWIRWWATRPKRPLVEALKSI